MKNYSTSSTTARIICIFLLITTAATAQNNSRKGFYASLQPGFVWINEKETSDPIPSTPLPHESDYTRIALALDTQVGWTVSSNLMLHGTLILTFGDSPDISELSTTVDLAGGGATYYIPYNFFVTGNVGASFANDKDCCAYTQFENGLSYQLKVGKEWSINTTWELGLAVEYGSYSTEYGYIDVMYKNTVKRFGFRAIITRY